MKTWGYLSLDVKALYPSLRREVCEESVFRLIVESDVAIEEVDAKLSRKLLYFL